MRRRFIVNADDYGLTPGAAQGIREAHRGGIVSSTSAMMNMPGAEEELRRARVEAPRLGLGVHLIVTAGVPVSKPELVPSLVDGEGRFWKITTFIERLGEIKLDEVEVEWRAQVERFVRATGENPTHFDSHHHSSYFTPGLFEAMLGLARELGCGIRYPFTTVGGLTAQDMPGERLKKMREIAPRLIEDSGVFHPDVFRGDFFGKAATKEKLLAILADPNEGVTEVMCHPSYRDERLTANTSYTVKREEELEILTDGEVRGFVESENIVLVSFKRAGE